MEFNGSFIFADGTFATFTTPPPVTLTVQVTGNGIVSTATQGAIDSINCGGVTPQVPTNTGETDCVGTYVQGSVVTLTENPYTLGGEEEGDARAAAAAPPISFGGWSGACSGTGPTCTVTMSADASVGATFTGPSSGPSPAPPSASAINAAVSSALKVIASIAAIAHAGGYQANVSVLVPGTLSITWNTGSGTHGTRSVVVASGSLHGKGELTEDEFTRAKAAVLLSTSGDSQPTATREPALSALAASPPSSPTPRLWRGSLRPSSAS